MSLSRPWRLLLLPLAVGAALRLHQAWAFGGHYMPHHDREEGYYETALSLLGAGSFGLIPNTSPSSFRAPVYPSWIALTQAPFKRSSPRWTRWAQALLSTLLIAACFALAARAASLEAGAWAAWLCALDPLQIAEVGGLNVHAFYGFMVLALGAGLVLWLEKRTPRLSILTALLLAASLLTRSAHYPLPLLWLGALWLWRLPGRPWRAAALTAAATALFLMPVLARNWLQFGRFILLDSHKGAYVLLRSTAGPYVNTTVEEALETAEEVEPGFAAKGLQGEALFDGMLRLAVKNALSHPLDYARYCLQRLWLFWRGLWAYVLLAAAGLLLLRSRRGLQGLAVAAASFSGYALAGGTEEYRVSVTPLLCVLAGAGAAALLARVARRRLGPPQAALTGALGAPMAVAGASYAAMLVFLCAELALHPLWRGEPSAPGLSERVLGVLDDAAVRMGPRGIAARVHAESLMREAWRASDEGDEERSAELLARFTRLPPADGGGEGKREALRLSLRRAQRLSERGRRDEARDLAQKALAQASPGQGQSPAFRAELHWRANQMRRAEEDLARALDALGQKPMDSATAAELRALRVLARPSLDGAGRAQLAAAVASQPERVCRGLPGFVNRGRLPTDYFDLCLKRFPRDAGLLCDRGVARFLKGDAAGAEMDVRQALRAEPGSVEAALSLATLLCARGQGGEAGSALSEALSRRSTGGARARRSAEAFLSSLRASGGCPK